MKSDAIMATPPVGVGVLSLAGIPLAQWVVILTAIYTIFLIIDKLPIVIKRVQQLVAWLRST